MTRENGAMSKLNKYSPEVRRLEVEGGFLPVAVEGAGLVFGRPARASVRG